MGYEPIKQLANFLNVKDSATKCYVKKYQIRNLPTIFTIM